MVSTLYEWPKVTERTELDRRFSDWCGAVHMEIADVVEAMHKPVPDDPVLLDAFISQWVDGWMARIASLGTIAEWFLQEAKSAYWPEKLRSIEGKPLNTDADRAMEHEGLLKDYRFMRNYLDALLTTMRDRMRWSQSVRRQHVAAQDSTLAGF